MTHLIIKTFSLSCLIYYFKGTRSCGKLGHMGKAKWYRDDDFADRLNHIYTVLTLVVFAMFITTGTHIGEPIVCYYKEISRKQKLKLCQF